MKSIISISVLLLVVIFFSSVSGSFDIDVFAASEDSECKKIEKSTRLTCEQQRINSMLTAYIELVDNDDNKTLGEKLQVKQNLEKLILLNTEIKNPYYKKSTNQIFSDFEKILEKTELSGNDLKRIETIWFDNTVCDKLSEKQCEMFKDEVLSYTDKITGNKIPIDSMNSLLKIIFSDVIEKPSDENSALGLKDCTNSLSFSLDKSEYHQGDNIIISGSVSNTLDSFVTLNIVNTDDKTLSYIGQYSPDKQGKFSDIVKIGSTFGGGLYSHIPVSNNKMYSEFFA